MRSDLVNMILILLLSIFFGCKENDGEFVYIPEDSVANISLRVVTDQARYTPGTEVIFTADELPEEVIIRYSHLNEVLAEEPMTSKTWTWTPPTDDFKGYMVDFFHVVNGEEQVISTVAIDVSSDWTRFPRYGFLSEFGDLSENDITDILSNLKDYHINGLQYYDWHNKHHSPLKMNGTSPASTWVDVIGRPISFASVESYISRAHELNMASMQYNLLYGAWEDYDMDGVSEEWMIYSDANHQNVNKHDLPDDWQSDILVTNPANQEWQKYIFEKTALVYDHLEFDGWHLDQLGNRGNVYDYFGNAISLNETYAPFLNHLHAGFPDKKMVLNAVNQYGQSEILNTAVDFAYTEVWDPNNTYKALADIILKNNEWSNGELNTVLAAYMNYDLANSPGSFNTPAVLLTDAVIFGFGGAHLELGEHMLAKEYFPNNNLKIRGDLKKALLEYYDFMVAYQNLLRDGGEFIYPELESGDGKVTISSWPPQMGHVSAFAKEFSNRRVVHLINFNSANSLNWRDTDGTQPFPTEVKNFRVNFISDQPITKVWWASPDVNEGVSQELDFAQNASQVSLTLPSLTFWDMLVVEY
ncbi:MAG: glycoside hydrolase family 66 protein [Marinoscillum sp.]|uniref:glycoside hydrolase family 66 protein n=1 Tax=Marinoscillum sp. TaxID=2024838 RepID=UPI0032F899FC